MVSLRYITYPLWIRSRIKETECRNAAVLCADEKHFVNSLGFALATFHFAFRSNWPIWRVELWSLRSWHRGGGFLSFSSSFHLSSPNLSPMQLQDRTEELGVGGIYCFVFNSGHNGCFPKGWVKRQCLLHTNRHACLLFKQNISNYHFCSQTVLPLVPSQISSVHFLRPLPHLSRCP